MGIWSDESFGNDAAGDWIMDLRETPTFNFLEHTLQQHHMSSKGDPYPMLEAIAAAEVVCILKGNGPADYDADKHSSNHNLDPALEVLKKQPLPAKLVTHSVETVVAIKVSDAFKELSEDDELYHNEIQSLITRLML